MAPAETLRVELVWSPRTGEVKHLWLEVPRGASVGLALAACADFAADQVEPLSALRIGVWGRPRPLDTPLRDRDRIEVYRPLTVDPKEARRLRYAKRGERIISRHRPKAGR
jgi:hypothetical protein